MTLGPTKAGQREIKLYANKSLKGALAAAPVQTMAKLKSGAALDTGHSRL